MAFTETLPFFLVVGVCAGILAGIFGVGGGLIIVPALTIIAGYSQVTATGTSLVALLLPIGAAGVYAFYQSGQINMGHVKDGLMISVGMFLGSYFGAKIALSMPDYILKRAFCIFLLAVAARMWIMSAPKAPQ
ncbi:MAG TPA: sulfite exporter TauE/SafE family protein [Alphaproteobacteria bacterium]|nr:sulfite exporter TauE/SafE family protein [Alphaproteobacteria bacterium]